MANSFLSCSTELPDGRQAQTQASLAGSTARQLWGARVHASDVRALSEQDLRHP